MAINLSGSLSEFGLAEVLSLLSMGGRTARTQVSASPTSVGVVHMVDGQICSASADLSRAGLLRSVVAALPVTADDLALAVGEADPVRSLVDSGVVDREVTRQVAGEHCAEAIGEMLRWSAGRFEVSVGEVDPGDIGLRIETSELTGSAQARNEQWQELRSALPAPDSVLALAAEVGDDPVVDVADWQVLARIDGHRTLDGVLAANGATPLAAGRRLIELLGRGLVEVRVGDGPADQERTCQLLDSFEQGHAIGDVPAEQVLVAEAPVHVGAVGVAPEQPLAWADSFTPVDVDEPADPQPAPPLAPVPGFDDEPAEPIGQALWDTEHQGETEPRWDPERQWNSEPEWNPEPRWNPEPQWEGGDQGEAEPDRQAEPEWELLRSQSAAVDAAYAAAPPTGDELPVSVAPVMLAPEAQPVAAVEPPAFRADPVASLDAASAQFAWSPWAQEMGLGEPSPAQGSGVEPAEATSESEGFAASDLEAMPAPQAPRPEASPASAGYEPGSAPETQPAEAADDDPLAEGLLAQLMSSVRGM